MTDEDIAAEAQQWLGTLRVVDKGGDTLRWFAEIGDLHKSAGYAGRESVEREMSRQWNVILAAVAKARRQLPLDSPIGEEQIREAKKWAEDPYWFGYAQRLMRNLLAHIEHLEKMLAFVMVDQEGERAAELLAMAKEEGRRELASEVERLRSELENSERMAFDLDRKLMAAKRGSK